MTSSQKNIKSIAIALATLIIISLLILLTQGISYVTNLFTNTPTTSDKTETYDNLSSIEIDSLSLNIIIKPSSNFKIEMTNLKNKVSSKVKNNRLKIEESPKWLQNGNIGGTLTIYVKEKALLDNLSIDSGAGKIELNNISSKELEIDQGAGLLKIVNSNFQNTDIDGGAGAIEITNSLLNNLDLDAGIGKVELDTTITGNSQIDCGVGEVNLTLQGSKENYKLIIDKGIGTIKINNQTYNNHTEYGLGPNQIEITGGIGTIKIDFPNNK